MMLSLLLAAAAAVPAAPPAPVSILAPAPQKGPGAAPRGSEKSLAELKRIRQARLAAEREALIRENLNRRTGPRDRGSRGTGSQGFSLGGALSTGLSSRALTAGPKIAPGVFQLQFDDTGTGWQESVILGVPQTRSGGPVPLLVMFHAYDLSEFDCYANGTDLFEGARNRGWYVLAPLGAQQVNFGIYYAQQNIEYVLSYFQDKLPIDPDRIYGVGFSMGGGGVMSYASRHLDPDLPRFAAVVNHTGAVSTANAYWNTTDTFVFDDEDTFGGSPTDNPFLYSQASCMDIDPFTFEVNPLTDLARNLAHVPVLNHHAKFDPESNLVAVTQTAFSWLSGIPGMETFLLSPPVGQHRWNTLNAEAALDYLGSKTLQTPTTGEHFVLADREARWFHFYVYQDAPEAFTPFRWNYEYAQNRLTLDQTENLQRVMVDTVSLGINTAVNLDLVMGSADGTGEVVTLSGYAQPPQQVLRNGLTTTSWTWDAVSESVTLTEGDASGGVLWRVRP